jgi:hypothetical protein
METASPGGRPWRPDAPEVVVPRGLSISTVPRLPRTGPRSACPVRALPFLEHSPVTRRSGKRDLVVAHRLACNRYLADAVHKLAFTSLRRSGWAREFYDTQRARGKNHHAALRALGNRWFEVLWHCLTHEIPYHEAVHIANRNRALAAITSSAA